VLRAEIAAAFMLLTRLPVGWIARGGSRPQPARCVWAYPVVGLVVGGIGAGAYLLCHRVGMPAALGAVWTLVVTMLATGALHEDGLADTADGFGGGRSPERKLQIMRDSRIGSYGTLALLLSVAIRGVCIAALAQPGRVAPALIAAGALARGSIGVLLLALPPARPDGLAATLRERDPVRTGLGPAVAVAVAFVLLPGKLAGGAVVASGLAALALGGLARRQIGGYTGDVLGAGAVTAECAVLTLLAATWRA
jgi:adenosylcobinamide-GDP ribazoletransferase